MIYICAGWVIILFLCFVIVALWETGASIPKPGQYIGERRLAQLKDDGWNIWAIEWGGKTQHVSDYPETWEALIRKYIDVDDRLNTFRMPGIVFRTEYGNERIYTVLRIHKEK